MMALALLVSLSAAPPCDVTLRGIVTHEESGEGIPSVDVKRDGVSIATTQSDGRYVVNNVCRRQSRLSFERQGFVTMERTWAPGAATEELNVALAPEQVTVLDDVIVLAPARLERTAPSSMVTLDDKALARVRGRNLAGTLAELPGVTTLDAGPQSSKPVVHGQFGRRVLTLFDGVRHEGQDWGTDHAPEIDPFAAGTLSVVKGAAGVRYGPDAIGGVILVDPRPLRLTSGVDGELHLIGVDNGLRGTIAGRVDVAHSWLPGFALRLEGNLAKGAAVSAPDYVLGNTASDVWNMGITAGYQGDVVGQALDLKVSLRHHQSTLGVCYCLGATSPDTLRAQATLGRPPSADQWVTTYEIDRPYQSVAHTLGLARGKIQLGPVGTLSATYSVQVDVRDEFDQVRNAVTGPQFHFNLVTHAIDVVFESEPLAFEGFSLRSLAGVQGMFQENAYSGLQLIPNYRRFTGGAFLLEQLRIPAIGLGDLELDLGARYDQLAQSAFLTESAFNAQVRRGRLDGAQCARTNAVAECPLALPALSFTAGAKWLVDVGPFEDALTFSTGFATASRFPDADELYLGGRAPTFPVFGLGDGRLTTETSSQVSLGVAANFPFLAVDVEGYAMSVNDYIAFGPTLDERGDPVIDVLIQGAFPRYSYRAVDAIFSGVDVGAVLAPGALISFASQLSMVRGLDATNGRYLPFVPPLSLRVEISANLPAVFAFTPTTLVARSNFVAKQTRSDAFTDFAPAPPAYMLLDAEARTGLAVFGQQVSASIEARNLLNQRRRDYMSLTRYAADQVGREVWLRLSVEFGT